MSNILSAHLNALHGMFKEDLLSIFDDIDSPMLRKILPHAPAIFRRWYYSTLIENIHFSPANLVDTMCHFHGAPPGTHIVTEVSTFTKMPQLQYKLLSYSMDAHPIVADLRRLVDLCTPHIDLCEEWCFSDVQAIKYAKKLSLRDPEYAAFLLDVICKMKILVRMPSLYVQRMHVSVDADEILALPNVELLRRITDAVVELAAEGLQSALPAPVPFFHPEHIRQLIVLPQTTDDILGQVFSSLGYNLDSLLRTEAFDPMDDLIEEAEQMAEIMSSIFFLGVMLDKLFFTPFGYFLKFVRPVYSIPFSIEDETEHFTDEIEDLEDGEIISAFFAPCTSYTLTDLGAEFFGVEKTEENYLDTRFVLPPEILASGALVSPIGIRVFVDAAKAAVPLNERADTIYTFRVCAQQIPTLWINIQIQKTATLHMLFEEVMDAFYITDDLGYNFYHGATESPFTEYVGIPWLESQKKAKYSKKHSHIMLTEIDFDHMAHMILVAACSDAVYNMRDINMQKFTLEWIDETAPEINVHYPYVSEASESMQQISKGFGG